jgi:peptidoglycan/LPS O-acetylase OafA/YrhL
MANSSPTNPEKVSSLHNIVHLKYLDALRGIAVLGVMLVHCAIYAGQTGVAMQIGIAGQRGVQLFYVISAFTLYYTMSVRKDMKAKLLSFYIRRFFRIAPLFYIAIILNLCYKFPGERFGASSELPVYDVFLGIFFLHGFKKDAINAVAIGGWSIAVETTFYVILPMLFIYINTYKKALILTLTSAIVLFSFCHLLADFLGDDYREYLTFTAFPIQFPVFCTGILTFFIWKKTNEYSGALQPFKKQISFFLLLMGGVIFMLAFMYSTSFIDSNKNLHLSSFGFLLLIIALSQYPWKILVNKLTLNLGKVSYSVYLMHFFVLLVFDLSVKKFFGIQYQQFIGQPILFAVYFTAVLGGSLVVCNITYHVIEKPGIALGKAIIARLQK